MTAGKMLMAFGLLLVIIGLIIHYAGKVPLIGRLPGDIIIERDNFKLYIPITSAIVVSVIITIIIYLIGRLRN